MIGEAKKNRLYKTNDKPLKLRKKRIVALLSLFVLPSLLVYGVITLACSLSSSNQGDNSHPKIANARQEENDPETILIYR